MARKTEHQMDVDAKKRLEAKGDQIIPFGYFKCFATGKILSVKQQNFYQTNNPMYKYCTANTDDGIVSLLPFSKKWIEEKYKELCIDTKNNDKLATYMLTQMLQVPWIEVLWQSASESKVASYKFMLGKLNSLPQYSSLTIADSEEYVGDIESTITEENNLLKETKMKKRDKKEALERWGNTWSEFQLAKLEELYHNMKEANRIETPQDEDYVRKLVRLSVKIDDAIEADESAKAKQLGDLYSKYMSDAKFRASDMSGKDLNGGARTISQIAEEVESDDFIPPWEKYAYKLKVSQDIVDKTIMYMLNFVLRFKDRPLMSEPPNDTPEVGDVDEL